MPAAIECRGLSKRYALFDTPAARMMQLLLRREPQKVHWALQGVNLTVARGEVLGVVGRNGAGKSTLLQLLCGTLTATSGERVVRGRVAALLELGAGFNPEFTGRENVVLNGALLGLQREQVLQRMDEILRFADIGDFIDQPVKTYSSGMFMRLAFAVATAVDPDILIIDEALSVGDGAFARKSFERIMALKAAGATILFCSHSMYQVEALCSRAVWLDGGEIRALGPAGEVCAAYQAHLNSLSGVNTEVGPMDSPQAEGPTTAPVGSGRITGLQLRCAEQSGVEVTLRSERDSLQVSVSFVCDPALPAPCVALGISDVNGLTISSALSLQDGARIEHDGQGNGQATLLLERVPLLKGRYSVTPFLLSEDGLHPYDQVLHAAHFNVVQEGPLQGVVSLPRRWL